MLDLDSYRELRNSKRYKTNVDHTLSENGSLDNNSSGNEEEVSEFRTLNKKAVNQQIKGFIALLTK